MVVVRAASDGGYFESLVIRDQKATSETSGWLSVGFPQKILSLCDSRIVSSQHPVDRTPSVVSLLLLHPIYVAQVIIACTGCGSGLLRHVGVYSLGSYLGARYRFNGY